MRTSRAPPVSLVSRNAKFPPDYAPMPLLRYGHTGTGSWKCHPSSVSPCSDRSETAATPLRIPVPCEEEAVIPDPSCTTLMVSALEVVIERTAVSMSSTPWGSMWHGPLRKLVQDLPRSLWGRRYGVLLSSIFTQPLHGPHQAVQRGLLPPASGMNTT